MEILSLIYVLNYFKTLLKEAALGSVNLKLSGIWVVFLDFPFGSVLSIPRKIPKHPRNYYTTQYKPQLSYEILNRTILLWETCAK